MHKGRFGYVANNFISRTPVDNSWEDDWSIFFAKRLKAQLDAAFSDKVQALLQSGGGRRRAIL